MRDATPALRALLAGQQFVKCNLFTLKLTAGQTYYWTDADVDVVAGVRVYDSSGPSISGARYQLVRGLQVSTLDLRVLVKPTDLIAGVPWSLAARSGALKNAQVVIAKAFMPEWGAPAEALEIFDGYVDESSDGEQELTLSVVSNANRLNAQVPKKLFRPGCWNTLYGPACGVQRALYSATGVVTGVPNRYSFQTDLAKPDDYFALGELTFTSGPNAGVRRAVKAYRGSLVTLSYPLVFDLEAGDGFKISAGCDKTRGPNGCAKFNNEINYRATPYVPPPEAAT